MAGLAKRAFSLALMVPVPCCCALPALALSAQSAMMAAGVRMRQCGDVMMEQAVVSFFSFQRDKDQDRDREL